nr:hypothetical protein [Edwardsiella ictaluri]
MLVVGVCHVFWQRHCDRRAGTLPQAAVQQQEDTPARPLPFMRCCRCCRF